MKLSIFSRLVAGYLVIFILAIAVSIYAIVQLRQVEDVTQSILTVDNSLMDLNRKLSDVMLSMIRYERKFMITKDEGLYSQFRLEGEEFTRHLETMRSLPESGYPMEFFAVISQLHQRYVSLFEVESTYVRAGQPYPVEKFKEEKENTEDEIMDGLKKMRDLTERNTYGKLQTLRAAEANARKIVIIMGTISLVVGIILSVFITINITKPLSLIKRQTKEIAKGEFGAELNFSSPPEIAELARSFNFMCSKLKEIDRMKSDFFSMMSHELRTPLTTIKEGTNLFLEGLKEGEATEKQKRLLNIIKEECNRMINLVNTLLDLSKIESGMMVYNFTQGDIAELIAKVTREIEPLAEKKKISIEKDISDHVPPVNIDPDRILLVLRNLISNAVKFTPSGGSVHISAHPGSNGIRVEVKDTGAGISKEKIEIIFDKYQRAVVADSGKITGSGLGLFMAKQIINAHGGRLWAESTLGEGSSFIFNLPV